MSSFERSDEYQLVYFQKIELKKNYIQADKHHLKVRDSSFTILDVDRIDFYFLLTQIESTTDVHLLQTMNNPLKIFTK